MNALKNLNVLAALVIAAAGGSRAAQDVPHAGMSMSVRPTAAADSTFAALTRGMVRKIDVDAGTITIQHGAIDSLGMPAMTMVYRAAHPGLLDQVRVGEAIGFQVERIDGAFVVTRLQAQ